jgi:proteasome accessory factor C
MPKLKYSLPGDDRYNTLMSIVALLQREGEMHIDELARHFDLPVKTLRSMLSTLNTTSYMPRNSEEQLPFFIDVERIDEEDGVVSLQFDSGPVGVPKITTAQAVSLLTGLNFLKNLPDFEDDENLDELIHLLSFNQEETPDISIEKHEFDSDLAVIKQAILEDWRIECRYVNSRGEESQREIDPLLLVADEGHWYLRGYCLKNLEIRTFRLDHMVDAKLLTNTRSAEAIEAAKSIDELSPIYNPKENDLEIELELAPEAYTLAGMFRQLKEPEEVGDENIRVTIQMSYLPDLGPLICKFAGNARVISPPSAREVVANYASKILSGSDINREVD